MPDKREEKHSFITLKMNGYHFSLNFSPIDSEMALRHHQSITDVWLKRVRGNEGGIVHRNVIYRHDYTDIFTMRRKRMGILPEKDGDGTNFPTELNMLKHW